jgi:signal-transduction protein with cAMP-binding, CBS, and nucleotidyltransferase domain
LAEKEGNYIGIVTDADFTRKIAREDLPVNTSKIEDIMSAPIVIMDQSASIMEAHELMLNSKIRHLAVTDEKNYWYFICSRLS